MNTVWFSYYNTLHEIKLDVFKQHSDFEIESKHGNHNSQPISLLSSFRNNSEITEEVINNFVDFFKNGEIKITDFNAIGIQTLSTKYQIKTLQEKATEYIEKNRTNIINEILTKRILTYKTEIMISEEIPKILNDDRLLFFSISELNRILRLYSKHHQKEICKLKEEDKKLIIDFLYKVISNKGPGGTILMNIFDFSDNEYYRRKFFSNFSDFNFSIPTNNLIGLINNLYKQNEEQLRLNKEKENKYEQEIADLKKRISKLESISNERNRKINEMNKNFEEEKEINLNEIETLKKTIYKITSTEYFSKQEKEKDIFNEFDGETQRLIIMGKSLYCDKFKNLHKLLSYFTQEQRKAKFKFNSINYINIEKIDMNDINQEQILIKMNAIEMLDENKTLESDEFIEILKQIDGFYIELDYPNINYEQIYSKVLRIKNKSFPGINICVNINKIIEGDKTFQGPQQIKKIKIKTNDYIIPGGYQKGLFECNTFVEEIIIPSSVTTIGGGTFYLCQKLKEIKIPSSVSTIEGRSFGCCSSLIKIIIPPSVKYIGEQAFYNCENLKEITIDPYKTKLSTNSFERCSSLHHLTFSKTIEKIKQFNFDQYFKITSITIPDSVTMIEEYSFSQCTTLREISIPSSIKSIEKSTFKGCTSLNKISIPTSVEKICEHSFENCSSLSEISIPSSIKSIEKSTFKGCTSLNKISIPTSVEKICEHSFENCSSLSEISIPSSIISIGIKSFSNCISLRKITIPSSVKSIGDKAFARCTKLQHIFIPFSITSFGLNVFEDTSSLKLISIPCHVSKFSLGINNSVKILSFSDESVAIFNHAYEFQYGTSVSMDKSEAVKYYKMAIDKGDASAMNMYGYMLGTGDGIEVNKSEAVKYFKMSADKGNAVAISNYGYMLQYGYGIEVNKSEAVKYYKMAIDKGDAFAMNNYGYMLETGDGVEVNKSEAVKYYKMSADKGCNLAMNNYANKLFYGEGIAVNKAEAIKYYKMAAEKGNKEAIEKLKTLQK